MALETDVRVESVPCPEARPLLGPVGSVALRAFHRSLQHLVTRGKRKLPPDFLVARETEVRVFFLQQVLCCLCPVDPVAVVAAHGAQFVVPSPELEEFLLFLMAGQAGIGPHRGGLLLEGEDGALGLLFCMLAARSVAGLTLLFPVRAFLKSRKDLRVAPFARLRTHVPFLASPCLVLAKGDKDGQPHRNGHRNYHHAHQVLTLRHDRAPSFRIRMGFSHLPKPLRSPTFAFLSPIHTGK